MSNPGYLRSTDGASGDNGSTWALANDTIKNSMVTGSGPTRAAGDRVWVSDNHAEVSAAQQDVNVPGTLASPCQILCGDDAAEPPTALATTATFGTTGANGFTFQGSFYWYGGTFNIGTGGSTSSIGFSVGSTSDWQVWDTVDFIITSSATPAFIGIGGSSSAFTAKSRIVWKNCDVKFNAAQQTINVYQHDWRWMGGSVLSGGTSPNVLVTIGSLGRTGDIWIEDVDLSNCSAGVHIFAAPVAVSKGWVVNCKLPTSWSGSLVTGTKVPGFRAVMMNCDAAAGDTNYKYWLDDYAGTVRDSSAIYRSASDGTTSLSYKMDTSVNGGADCEFPTIVLETEWMATEWNDTTGSSKTVTVEIVHDSATNLKDDEVWVEVRYMGTSTQTLGTVVTDAKATILTTAADQDASSVTWTGTGGFGNVNKQKLVVSFTPQEKGPFQFRVCLAKPSKVIYFCPKADIT